MHLSNHKTYSLKARIALFSLGITLVSLWTLSYLASEVLRKDMERLLGDQQLATTSMVAAQINRELEVRLETVQKVAKLAAPHMTKGPSAMQLFLEQRLDLHTLFSSYIYATDAQGVRMALFPSAPDELRISFKDRDYIAKALDENKATIGRPVIGRTTKRPLLVMGAPVVDRRGKVIGALAASTTLAEASYLDQVAVSHYGKTGGYLLVSRAHQLIIAAADKNLVMTPLRPTGEIPVMDQYVNGHVGSAIYTRPSGEEVLSSAAPIPIADWIIVALLPTQEAFAPIRQMQQFMLLATIVLSLLAGGLTWWMSRRHLLPLLTVVQSLSAKAKGERRTENLRYERQDEIGVLIDGFNHVLKSLDDREAALIDSEFRWKFALEGSGDGVWDWNLKTDEENYSRRWKEMLGYSEEDIIPQHHEWDGRIHPDDRAFVLNALKTYLEGQADIYCVEYRLKCKDESYKWIQSRGIIVARSAEGHPLRMIGTHTDISARKTSEEQLQKLSLAVEQSPSSIVITNTDGEIEYVNDAFVQNTGYARQEVIGQNPRILKSGQSSPDLYMEMWTVLTRGDAWKGELHNQRKDGSKYIEYAVITPLRRADGQVTHYVAVKDDISARKAAEEQANSLTFFDPLTQLPNRRLLMDRLRHALAVFERNKKAGALLLIDLDHFKTLNDSLGHEMGDILLQQVAQRLNASVREGDTVGRLGGDEFLIILENLNENTQIAASQAQLVGEMIHSRLSESYQVADYSHSITPSIGVAFFALQKNTDDLLQQAELAMYQAKASGRNALRFFDPEMQKTVSIRATLEADLRQALAEKQFFLHYQAQIASNGRLMGAEVLLRWRHPERGMVSPADFIPLAEETGMILPIGHWVLQTACKQLAHWASQPEMSSFSLAVNVSARQFKQPGFVKEVLSILERTGANPTRLKLELTENMLVEDVEDMIVKMSTLKARGVSFSLDDFGTGYSSLSYLKRLPLDQLKIDQGFIRDILTDPNDAAIAITVIALADSLGLGVIAEGVELEAQKDFLARHGCHAYQGYFYSRPLPLQDFEPFARTIGAEPAWVIIG